MLNLPPLLSFLSEYFQPLKLRGKNGWSRRMLHFENSNSTRSMRITRVYPLYCCVRTEDNFSFALVYQLYPQLEEFAETRKALYAHPAKVHIPFRFPREKRRGKKNENGKQIDFCENWVGRIQPSGTTRLIKKRRGEGGASEKWKLFFLEAAV